MSLIHEETGRSYIKGREKTGFVLSDNVSENQSSSFFAKLRYSLQLKESDIQSIVNIAIYI
jgi:hypothetical protein